MNNHEHGICNRLTDILGGHRVLVKSRPPIDGFSLVLAATMNTLKYERTRWMPESPVGLTTLAKIAYDMLKNAVSAAELTGYVSARTPTASTAQSCGGGQPPTLRILDALDASDIHAVAGAKTKGADR